ncbi:MAG: O-antigen ligase family protein [Eubacteriales bacterium]|nr:O-antigen ligase family protein [Eubacteriales bacterium]
MNRKIRAYQEIVYIVLFYLALALLLLGPGRLLEKDRLVAGNEAPAGTAQVRLDQQIQQVFVAQGEYLRYLELYVSSEDSVGKYYHLFVYNEKNEILVNREFELRSKQAPGFVRIPVGIETEPDTAYVWQLKGTDTPMELAWENTGETGLTCFGDYYILSDGETAQQPAKNIVMRLVYTDRPSAIKLGVLAGGLCLLAAALSAAAVYLTKKRQKLMGRVSLRAVLWATAGPLLAGGTIYLCRCVFWKNEFGGKADDKLVYGLGIGLTFLFFAWVLLAKRTKKHFLPFRQLYGRHWADWLQAAAFAGALWGCINYMNALYQNQQDLAALQVFGWCGLLILTMARTEELFARRHLVWLLLGGGGGLGWYLYRRFAQGAEGIELSSFAWELLLVFWAVLIVSVLAQRVWEKRLIWGRVNRPYAAALCALLLLLVLFRNGRGWPVWTAVSFGLFYLFYLGWERRERLLANFCDGVALNFALALLFALARRPFRAWVYSRYNFVFHTVTVTAVYLTLVVCVLTVRLLSGLRKKKRLADLWGTLLLYGMSAALLFLTLSRTGYLAVLVMTVIMVPFLTFFVYRKGGLCFVRNLACMGLCTLLCLPALYTGIRLLPALYNDPYLYEVEDSAAAIHRDDPKDSDAYMSVSYFKYVMDEKLLSGAERLSGAAELLCGLTEGPPYVTAQTLVASEEESGLSDVDEFSNGRLEIFKAYIGAWNLTGHPEMGVKLPDGSVSVHAHNTYLQVIHDHGLIVGIAFLAFGAATVVLLFAFALRRSEKERYAALPAAVFLGFGVAGLVEWLFHPCNPLGFAALVVIAPLLVAGGDPAQACVPEKKRKR